MDSVLVLSLAKGLLGEVHPDLRQASIKADERAHLIRLCFEYDGDAFHLAQESCSCAAAEVIADFSAPWDLDEQHIAAPVPGKLSSLKHVVYRRWEPEEAV